MATALIITTLIIMIKEEIFSLSIKSSFIYTVSTTNNIASGCFREIRNLTPKQATTMAGKIPFWQGETLRRTGLILWVRLLLMACWVKEEKKGRQGRNRHIDHTCKYSFNSADADSVSRAWRWQHLLQLNNSGKQSGRRHTGKHLITNTGSQWREEGGGDRHRSICDITNENKAFFLASTLIHLCTPTACSHDTLQVM